MSGFDKEDLKILDPFNIQADRFVYKYFLNKYPDIFYRIVKIEKTFLKRFYIVTYNIEWGSNDIPRQLIFDYDSGDILGIIGMKRVPDNMFDFINMIYTNTYIINEFGDPSHMAYATGSKIVNRIYEFSDIIRRGFIERWNNGETNDSVQNNQE